MQSPHSLIHLTYHSFPTQNGPISSLEDQLTSTVSLPVNTQFHMMTSKQIRSEKLSLSQDHLSLPELSTHMANGLLPGIRLLMQQYSHSHTILQSCEIMGDTSPSSFPVSPNPFTHESFNSIVPYASAPPRDVTYSPITIGLPTSMYSGCRMLEGVVPEGTILRRGTKDLTNAMKPARDGTRDDTPIQL